MKLIIKNQKGFTLVELLIALVIFAVGILGVATMQTTSIKGNSKSRQISEASNVAADQIEKIMSLKYDDAILTDGAGTHDGIDGLDDLSSPDHTLDSDSDGVADDQDGDGIPDVRWNIAVNEPLQNTKTIKVIVDPPGSSRNVEMTYIKMDKGF